MTVVTTSAQHGADLLQLVKFRLLPIQSEAHDLIGWQISLLFSQERVLACPFHLVQRVLYFLPCLLFLRLAVALKNCQVCIVVFVMISERPCTIPLLQEPSMQRSHVLWILTIVHITYHLH